MNSYAARLKAAQAGHSDLLLLLKPRLQQIPLPMQRFDDPFLPFGRAIIDAARPVVCGYVFDLAAYMTLGAAGMVALERTIAYVGESHIKILHAPFASGDYAEAVGAGGFNVDAVTLVDEEYAAAYMTDPQRGVYVIRRGDTPVLVPFPPQMGIYWQDAALLSLIDESGYPVKCRLAGESVLYAGRGDDFTERVRAALEELR